MLVAFKFGQAALDMIASGVAHAASLCGCLRVRVRSGVILPGRAGSHLAFCEPEHLGCYHRHGDCDCRRRGTASIGASRLSVREPEVAFRLGSSIINIAFAAA